MNSLRVARSTVRRAHREPAIVERCKEGMKRIATVLVGVLVAALAALVPAVASAGGWAVPSLDPLPSVRAGAPVDVGFVLLQHGRTPVVAADWSGAAIGIAV